MECVIVFLNLCHHLTWTIPIGAVMLNSNNTWLIVVNDFNLVLD